MEENKVAENPYLQDMVKVKEKLDGVLQKIEEYRISANTLLVEYGRAVYRKKWNPNDSSSFTFNAESHFNMKDYSRKELHNLKNDIHNIMRKIHELYWDKYDYEKEYSKLRHKYEELEYLKNK